ncbi:MAG TPA: hypothetical protein VHX49_04395 [Candidatus Acidoferrales bacterium]|nr:hypothetical protein [Candidatus Acidoferrales bacterium]
MAPGLRPTSASAGRHAPPHASPRRAGDALFQHLHHRRRSADARLADEQVNMFGHHAVAEQREVVSVSDVAQDIEEEGTRCLGAQQRQAMVAAARDEVQVAGTVAAFKAMFHARPRTLQNRKGAAPTGGSVSSVVK